MALDTTRHNLGWTLLMFGTMMLLFWSRSLVAPVLLTTPYALQKEHPGQQALPPQGYRVHLAQWISRIEVQSGGPRQAQGASGAGRLPEGSLSGALAAAPSPESASASSASTRDAQSVGRDSAIGRTHPGGVSRSAPKPFLFSPPSQGYRDDLCSGDLPHSMTLGGSLPRGGNRFSPPGVDGWPGERAAGVSNCPPDAADSMIHFLEFPLGWVVQPGLLTDDGLAKRSVRSQTEGANRLYKSWSWCAEAFDQFTARLAPPPGVQGVAPLGQWIDRGVAHLPPGAGGLLAVVATFWCGVLLTRLVTGNMIVLERTYLPFTLYMMISSGICFGDLMLNAHIATLMMVGSYKQMMESFKRIPEYAKSFNVGMLSGSAAVIYAPVALLLLVLMPCSMLILKKGWREWVITLAGGLIPLVICSYINWGAGEPLMETPQLLGYAILERLYVGRFLVQWIDPLLWLFIAVTLVLLSVSVYLFIVRSRTLRTRPYKTLLYFLWILIFSALLMLLPGRSVGDLPLFAAPMAVIIAPFLNRAREWITNLAYLLMVGAIILYNLVPLLLA